MNIQGKDPRDICVYLLSRSSCKVQVAAVLADNKGVFAWGVNHAGSGFGEHAEIHALKRANPRRVPKAAMYIAARRKKSGNPVSARPCAACAPAVRQCLVVKFRRNDGVWV